MSLDVHRLANARSKGKRPYFLASADAERVLNVVLALAQENAVLRERLDTLERILQGKGVMAQSELDAYRPDTRVTELRSDWTQAYLSRLFRIFEQDVAARQESPGDAATVDELAQR